MANKKKAGMVLLIIGLILLLLSVLADFIALGRSPGFGPRQITGIIVGAIVLLIGILLIPKKVQQSGE